jgi:excisionase family DNA binding protein
LYVKNTQHNLLSMKEVAEMLSISQRTVWSMTNAGEIPCVRIRKRVLYRLEHVQGFIEKKTEGEK